MLVSKEPASGQDKKTTPTAAAAAGAGAADHVDNGATGKQLKPEGSAYYYGVASGLSS